MYYVGWVSGLAALAAGLCVCNAASISVHYLRCDSQVFRLRSLTGSPGLSRRAGRLETSGSCEFAPVSLRLCETWWVHHGMIRVLLLWQHGMVVSVLGRRLPFCGCVLCRQNRQPILRYQNRSRPASSCKSQFAPSFSSYRFVVS